MPTETLAKYLNAKRVEKGLTYEAVANESNSAESTVKNLLTGKSEDPRFKTIIPIMEAVGGSFDEMLYPEKTKGERNDSSVIALKDMYEHQISIIKETHEAHVHNIRSHYEQHHEDLKENYERRLSDKRELIESYKEHIISLKKDCRVCKIAFSICVAVFIAVLIAELMNPDLGWFRF